MILKGLSTIQHRGQVGKVPPQCAAATQDIVSVASINAKKLSVIPATLKVEDDARPEDSMPPLPQARDDVLSDESWPLWEYVGIRLVRAKVDEDAVTAKFDAVSGGQSRKIQRLEDLHFQQIACRGRRKRDT